MLESGVVPPCTLHSCNIIMIIMQGTRLKRHATDTYASKELIQVRKVFLRPSFPTPFLSCNYCNIQRKEIRKEKEQAKCWTLGCAPIARKGERSPFYSTHHSHAQHTLSASSGERVAKPLFPCTTHQRKRKGGGGGGGRTRSFC